MNREIRSAMSSIRKLAKDAAERSETNRLLMNRYRAEGLARGYSHALILIARALRKDDK